MHKIFFYSLVFFINSFLVVFSISVVSAEGNCFTFDYGFCADSCDSSALFKFQGTMDDCNAQGLAYCCVPSSTTTTSGNTNNTVSTTGTATDTGCYDEFGTPVACTYNPATGQPINTNTTNTGCYDEFGTPVACTYNPATGQPINTNTTNTGCYDEFGTPVACTYNPATGQPLNTGTNNGGGNGNINGGTGGSVGSVINCPSGFNLQSGVCVPGSTSGIGLSNASVFDVISTVLNWLLGILGVLGVLAFVISGTQYLLSAGDEDLAKTAKRNMTYAIIGLTIALTGLIVVNAIAGLTGAGGVTNY